MTINQIDALVSGYIRRRDALEDLFICYIALPIYQTKLREKAPSYKALTAHRRGRDFGKAMHENEIDYWKEILKEAEEVVKIR